MMIFNDDYKNTFRTEKRYFSRKRKMGFPEYILFILGNSRKSLQVSLNIFFDQFHTACENYSKQAFSKQRQHIKPEALWVLFNLIATQFYQVADYDTWHGYVLAAVDGSRINLPDSHELENIFGVQTSQGAAQIQALVSGMFDILNGMFLDVSINPCSANERELAKEHIHALKRYSFSNVLLLMDRGYPSYELLQHIEKAGLNYLIRCDKSFIRGMKLQGNDCIIVHKFARAPHPIQLRVIKIILDNGIEEILVSNLFDEAVTLTQFKELYHLRWGIETAYKHIKSHLEIENFSGTTEIAVRQDFFASMFLSNLAQAMIIDMRVDMEHVHNHKDNNFTYQQNVAQTIGILKVKVVKMLLLHSNIARGRMFASIRRKLFRCVCPQKPHRSFPRLKKHKSSKFSNNNRPV